MQGLNKTKAALQGRQCHYRKLKPSQITTLIDQVNNLGRVKGCSEVINGHKLTAPLAQLVRDIRKSAHTVPNYGELTVIPSAILRPLILLVFSQSKSFASWWVYPNLDRPDMSDSPQWGTSTPMADTLSRTSSLAEGGTQSVGASLAFLRCSLLSLRPHASSTHDEKLALELSSFSRSTLASISSMSSCGNLIPFVVERLFLKPVAILFPLHWCRNTIQVKREIKSIDVYVHQDVRCMCTFVFIMVQIAKPGSVSPLTGPLTTNDRMSIEVAMLNHTQTRPKYQYRFLALHRSDRSAAPCRLSVEAFTEKEARQVLSAHFILSLAARLPVSEVCHA